MSSSGSRLEHRIKSIRQRIDDAARSVGRDPSEVRLVAVTKMVDADRIRGAYDAGLRDFGENYAQQLVYKHEALAVHCPDVRWHFIGHLQRNKVRTIVGRVHLIHSVDSIRLLDEIERRAAQQGSIQSCLIQVNVGEESQKTGIAPDQLRELLSAGLQRSSCRVVGLMTMPPYGASAEDSRPFFRQLRQLKDQAQQWFVSAGVQELSMGLSHDFEVAVQEGATHVRIGTAIFGSRPS